MKGGVGGGGQRPYKSVAIWRGKGADRTVKASLNVDQIKLDVEELLSSDRYTSVDVNLETISDALVEELETPSDWANYGLHLMPVVCAAYSDPRGRVIHNNSGKSSTEKVTFKRTFFHAPATLDDALERKYVNYGESAASLCLLSMPSSEANWDQIGLKTQKRTILITMSPFREGARLASDFGNREEAELFLLSQTYNTPPQFFTSTDRID